MTKITLEWAANIFNCGPAICSNNRDAQCAALCRSAQAVIEAAKSIQQLNYWSRPVTDNPCWDKLDKALAAHARNEQGTGEGG